MIDIKNNEDCCGCNACVQRCPKDCISMHEDHEGFLYPVVDKNNCINCDLCRKVCPIINQEEPRHPLKVYAAKNKNEQIRKESSSGGVFTLLAEQILKDRGVVFGAKFNDKWEVIHDYTETLDGLTAFRGSKYVQSCIGETYKQTEEFLKQGRKVLFSGTPCQIAGLNMFLRKKYDNLFTVDLICHGVPSPKVFRLYLEEIIKIKTKKTTPVITHINFRDKTVGWKKYGFAILGSNLKGEMNKNSILLSETLDKNIFMRGFLRDLYLRPSCHACPSKSLKSGSDITIADYWGIGNYYPEFDDDKGISLIIVNTVKGSLIFNKSSLDCYETNLETAIRFNSSFTNSVIMPKERSDFFCELNRKKSIIRLIKYYTNQNVWQKAKIKFYKLVSKQQ